MLRGINVNSQKKIQMTELKALYEKLNFTNVITYIQSGNVVFNYLAKDMTDLSMKIEQTIFDAFNFNVPVLLRTLQDMKVVLSVNPFMKSSEYPEDHQYVTFLAERSNPEQVEKIKQNNSDTDKFEVMGKEIFLYCGNGYGKTKLNNNFFEKKLQTIATTRNLNTVKKLMEIASALL